MGFRPGDPAHHGRQGLSGADFEEDGVRIVSQHAVDAVPEGDRRAQMAHIHGGIARFLRTDPAPGHVRDIGDFGIIQGVAADLLPERFKHRVHECGMEGVGHIEPLRLMPFRLQPFGQRLDRGAGATDNAAVRRIDGGEIQTGA